MNGLDGAYRPRRGRRQPETSAASARPRRIVNGTSPRTTLAGNGTWWRPAAPYTTGNRAAPAKPLRHDEVMGILWEALPRLKAEYGVRVLWLFGSVARDEANHDSDVDIYDKTTLLGLVGCQQALEALLGCPVDLSEPKTPYPDLRAGVMAERIQVE